MAKNDDDYFGGELDIEKLSGRIIKGACLGVVLWYGLLTFLICAGIYLLVFK